MPPAGVDATGGVAVGEPTPRPTDGVEAPGAVTVVNETCGTVTQVLYGATVLELGMGWPAEEPVE